AGADVDGRANDAIDAEMVESNGGADDVYDGVERADFVEVNFLDIHAVDSGFGFAEAAEDADGGLFDRRIERALVDDLLDRGQRAVVMVVADGDLEVGSGDAFALAGLGGERDL